MPKLNGNGVMMKNNNRFFFFCAVLSFMNAMFVSAADQVITWKKEAQEVDLYSDEALNIQWTGTHDVWLHDAAGCTGGGQQMAPEADSNWSAIGRKRSRGNALFKLQSWNSLRRKHDVEGNLPRRVETGRV